jgi:hypothetical protein
MMVKVMFYVCWIAFVLAIVFLITIAILPAILQLLGH